MTPTLSDDVAEMYFRQIGRCIWHPFALSAIVVEIELDTRLDAHDREYLMRILDEVTVGSHPGGEEPIDPVIVDDDQDSDDDDPEKTLVLPPDWTPTPDTGEAGAVYRDRESDCVSEIDW